ncbi:MAG TPA: TIGR01777 family oxidoreductase [Verrucomicrobiae bacterium]|nr:TIGR01777 family oxidoreductase [Verrucomicrobiae bacterium]
MNRRIVIAGGNGFLGRILAADFLRQKDEVIILTRMPRSRDNGVKEVAWDGRMPGDWTRFLDGARAVINLAGRSVDCRYHDRNRQLILNSRVESTRALGEAIKRCAKPPAVWLNASTATIYKHSLDRPMGEDGEIGATREAKDEFSVTVAQAWERTLYEDDTPKTRKITLRMAMVLGAGGGVFPVLRRLVRCGLGGKMAEGNQFVSWIHEADLCRSIQWLVTRDDFYGAVNLAAPNPIPNREMMRVLRKICGWPFGLPATAWMLEAGAVLLRTETELIIKSRRVVPGRLLKSGFAFTFPTMEAALLDILRHFKPELHS